MEESRREALRLFLAAAAGLAGGGNLAAQPSGLPKTPECGDADDLTPRQTAGPFFTPDSPEKTSLVVPGDPGMRLDLSGRVLTADCKPVSGALLDFWHADDSGRYDLKGYRYRGHLFTQDDGSFRLQTIRPGRYSGRTRHIHVRVQARNGSILTTQLYFPKEAGNGEDFLFRPELLMRTETAGGAMNAGFDFVIEA